MKYFKSFDHDLSAEAAESNSNRHDYNLLNNILNEFLFNGRFEHKEIYLDFEGDMASHVVEKLSEHPATIDNKIFSIVRLQLDLRTSNPFSTLTNLDENWKLSGFKGFPPTTLFLCSLVLVAEGMRAGERFSFNNYYDRFMDAFEIDKDDDKTTIKSCFKYTEKMWRNFNSWLIKNDGTFGLPTAKPFMENKPYISYPISQALIRRGDREHIREFLSSRGFNAGVEEDIGIVGEALGRWFKTTSPSKSLEKLWSHRSLRNIIILAAFKEIKNITAPFDQEQTGRRYEAKLKVRFKFKAYPKKNLLISFVAERKNIERDISLKEHVQSGVFEAGEDINLIPENTEIAVLGPPDYIKTGSFLSRGTCLIECDGATSYKFLPRHAMALEKKEDGFFYQVDRPKLFVEHAILVGEKYQKQVQDFVDLTANGNQKTIKNLPGLPDGYVCITGVKFIKSIPVEEWSALDVNYWLLPSENQINLKINGGLRLSGNTYHSKSELSFLFKSENEDEEVNVASTPVLRKITDSSITEKNYPIEIKDGVGCCELSTCTEGSFDRDIEISALKNSFSGVNVSLRSANNPRRASEIKYEFEADPVNLFKVLSCTEIPKEFSKINKFDGILSNSLHTRKKDKDIICSHKFVGNTYIEKNYNEEEEDFVYSTTLVGDGALSCIEKDFHIWKVPDKVSARDTHTQVCMDCNEKRQWVGTKNRKPAEKFHLIFDRPMRNFKLDHNTYDADTIFDAMCYLGSLNWDVMKRLCEEASAPQLYALNFVRQLSALGHIDIELNESTLKLKRCHVRKPHLTEGNNKFFLSGFRNQQIIDELTALIGEPTIRNNETSVVKEYVFDYFNIDLENEILQVLKQNCGVECTVVRDSNRGTKGDLDITDLYSSLPPVSLNTNSKFQKFDAQKCRWIDVESIDEPGGYRTQWPMTIYVIRLKNGELVVSTAALAKIYAADIKYLRLHDYNSIDRTFTSKVGCDLPPTVERALVSCTGILPSEMTAGNFVYSNIPEKMGYLILENHYGTNL